MKTKHYIFLLFTALILSHFTSLGQNIKISSDEQRRMHEEVIDDPYLPNVHNNQKTSPGYRYSTHLKSTISSIVTVQVNVNENGENIIDDAANEPSIAVNPLDHNKITIGWRQFDNIRSNFRQAGWGFSSNGGQNWTFPGVIEPGIFRSDPVLDFDRQGNFYYNSLTVTESNAYVCKVFVSENGGDQWNNGTDAGGGDKQWMVIDRTQGASSGYIYSVWNSYFTSCPPGFFTRSTNGNASYESCTIVDGQPYWGTMAVGNEGELYITGTNGTADSLLVIKSVSAREKDAAVTWNKPVMVFMDGNLSGWSGVNPGGLLGQANIDVDQSNGPGRNNIYLLAPLARPKIGDPCDIMFAKSTDGGLTWSKPILINDDGPTKNTQWFGTMSVAPNGRIDVIWLDTRDAPTGSDSSALYYSYSSDQGETWSVNEKLSDSFDPHTGYPNQNKLGDYFDMVSENSGAHLAWANTFNGEQDVYYSHIVPPVATGDPKIIATTSIVIFPNPTNDSFFISGAGFHSCLEIYNLLGERTLRMYADEAVVEIDLGEQPPGLYFVKVMDSSGKSFISKILKQ